MDAAEREQLILSCLQQVNIHAEHLSRLCSKAQPVIDIEDLRGDGYLALCKAADKFQPERGLKFKTYAEHNIRGAMLDRVRSHNRYRKHNKRVQLEFMSLDAHLSEFLGYKHPNRRADDAVTVSDLANDNGADMRRLEQCEITLDLLRKVQLSPRNKQIVMDRYGWERGLEEIAQQHSISASAVCQIAKNGLAKLAAA